MSVLLRRSLALLPLLLVLTGCAGLGAVGPSSEPTPTSPAMPEATPTEAPPPQPTATNPAGPSFEPAVYRDEVSGFEFDYPADWFVGPVQQYSRGGITAFTSWERPTADFPGETPAGETRLDVTIQLWDPKGDLPAFLEQRTSAWSGSGIQVLSQQEWMLGDGRPIHEFAVAGSDGSQAYFCMTTIGDNYLVLSGSGDLALLAEIAHTIRPIVP